MNSKSVKCSLRLKNFPFDVQFCYLEITTLTDIGKVSLSLQTNDDNYYRGSSLNVWTVINTQLIENNRDSILYGIILKRKANLYITDIIVPCTLLCLLSGLSLFIDSSNEKRLEINLAVIVAISVYQLLASHNLPTSDEIPILTQFLMVQVILVYSSLVITLVLLKIRVDIDLKNVTYRVPEYRVVLD